MKLHSGSALIALGMVIAWSAPAQAADPSAGDFPSKPIRWIVPYPPGGSNDVLGRYMGIKLGERIGQQVVIDNRGGANGIIGADLAAHAPADGYTLLMISTSFVMNAAVRPLPYDVEKSFDPVATIGSSPNCIVVSPTSGLGSLRDLIETAKAKPGSINYASTGVGGFNHFGGELFKKIAGVDLVHVPYRGGGPAMTDVMAGQVRVMFSSLTQVMPNIRTGRLKLIAVGSEKRSPVVPDTPTIAESGYPDYEVSVWWGVATPSGAPKAVLAKLRQEITAVLELPETKKRLMMDAAQPLVMGSAEMRKMIHAEVGKWHDVAQRAGIRVPGSVTAAK